MSESPRVLYLIRHAMPTFGSQGPQCIGRTDLPLSEVGRVQAAALARWSRTKGLTAVYSSPMQRAVETARFLAQRVIYVPDLKEMDMGEWEGMGFDAIRRTYPEAYAERGQDIAQVPPPGGESFVQCGSRAWAAFCEVISQSRGDIAIVGHCGVNRSLLCQIQGRSLSDVLTIKQPYCSVNTLIRRGGQWVVGSIGEVVS